MNFRLDKFKQIMKGLKGKSDIKKASYDEYNINIGGEFSYQRPTDSYLPLGVHDVAKIPLIPYSMRFLYDLMFFSTTLRTVVRALVWEIFRNGIDIQPKFACKCTVCGTEYNERYNICPNCGSDKLRLPNRKQYMKLKELMRRCNLNNDSLIDVLKDICYDGAVTDNMFLCVMKKYYYDDEGRLIGAEPVEILRGSPMKIRLVMSKDGRMGFTDDGRVVCFCPQHRKECELVSREEFEKGVRCKKCGKLMMPAWYETITGAGFHMFYAPGEILHAKIFTPGIGYGVSPILTVMIKVIVLMKMDWFVMTAYHLQRPPKGLLVLRGNRESISKAWQWLMEQARLNPHMIYPLVIEGTEQMASKRVAEWIDLSVKAQDIAFTEYRDEIRKAIGACYDDKTELLTRRGWLKWFQLQKGDEALCFDPETRELRWKPIKDIRVYDWNGKVYHFKTRSYDLVVTPEHRIIRYEENKYYKDGELIPKIGVVSLMDGFRGIYPQAGVWVGGEDFDGITIRMGRRKKKVKLDPYKLLEFVGLYVAEGWRSKKKYEIYISQSYTANKEKCEYIAKLLDELGVHYFTREMKGGMLRFIISCKDLHQFLGQFGDGAEHKTMAWIKDLKTEYIKAFMRGYFLGDGSTRSYGGVGEVERYGTKSRKLADELQEVFVKLGIGVTLQHASNGMYCIDTRIDKNGNDKWYSRIRSENVTVEHYKGKVWDVDCGGEFIVVRRNGRVAIQSNCFGVMPLFIGDTKSLGGLNSEGMQVLVTNRTVEAWQRLYNDKFFPWLMEQLGITDYYLRLRPNEVREESTEIELNMRKVQLANMVSALGYDVKLEDKNGKIEISFGERDPMSKLKDLVREVAREKGVDPTKIMEALNKVLEGKNIEQEQEDGGNMLGTVEDVMTQMNIQDSKRDWYNEEKDAKRMSGEPDRMKPRKNEQRFGAEPEIPKR